MRYLLVISVYCLFLAGCSGVKHVEAKYKAPLTSKEARLEEQKTLMVETVNNYLKQEQPDSAENFLNHLLEINPYDKLYRSFIYLNLGKLYESTDNYPKAYLSYRMALNLNPKLDDARYGLDRTNQLSLKE